MPSIGMELHIWASVPEHNKCPHFDIGSMVWHEQSSLEFKTVEIKFYYFIFISVLLEENLYFKSFHRSKLCNRLTITARPMIAQQSLLDLLMGL